MIRNWPITDKFQRRPTFERYLRRRRNEIMLPPSEAEKRDAVRILRDSWLWADALTEEALRVLDEAEENFAQFP